MVCTMLAMTWFSGSVRGIPICCDICGELTDDLHGVGAADKKRAHRQDDRADDWHQDNQARRPEESLARYSLP